MSLTSWVLDRWANRRAKPAHVRRSDEVLLYLRRLEDRRVLSLTAMPDAFYVEPFSQSFSASPQLGVLSNDFDPGNRGLLQAIGETITTDQGGSVTVDTNGAFFYIPPTNPGLVFVDGFTYTATNGVEFSTAEVTLFVGEIEVPAEQPTPLPIFGVETPFPSDLVEVTLISQEGASLTLEDSFLTFTFGNNGENDISFQGTAGDVNRALDTLVYQPSGFFGYDDLFFTYIPVGQQSPPPEGAAMTQMEPPGDPSQFVTIFVIPPDGPEPDGVVTVDDEYFVDSPTMSAAFFGQASVTANDFSTTGQPVFAFSETITTDLGGTVNLSTSGSFDYTPPTDPNLGPKFIDSFVYFAGDGEFISPGFVTIFVGDVPVLEDEPVLLPVFTVESETPLDFVTVQITSTQGALLLVLDPAGVTFDPVLDNLNSTIKFSGKARDVNFALDTLVYIPPLDYSGGDRVQFEYNVFGEPFFQEIPINVLPIADPPALFVSPGLVDYLPQIPELVDINVAVVDTDGSEIPGLVILQRVPAGVIPSVGQQSPFDPGTYILLPSELENLFFFVDFAAPAFFSIDVIATSIETTDQPGVFGGPGGPLLPEDPFDPRFGASIAVVNFFRLPMPVEPPPPPDIEAVFQLGPLAPPPPPKLIAGPENSGAPDAPNIVAAVIESQDSTGGNESSNSPVVSADGPAETGSDTASTEEESDDQSRRSSETSGIYVKKLGGDGPGQTAELPAELSEDYPRFMAFLKTLPNGDYVVYFKQGGQSHEQAEHRQVVVRVRVVNHRLNPDLGEFKPAGEVVEPPVDPNAPEAPPAKGEADNDQVLAPKPGVEWRTKVWTTHAPPAHFEHWAPILGSAGLALFANKLQSKYPQHPGDVDRRMETFFRKPFLRYRKRAGKNRT